MLYGAQVWTVQVSDVLLSIGTSWIVNAAAKLSPATVALINPVRFNICSQEQLLQGRA